MPSTEPRATKARSTGRRRAGAAALLTTLACCGGGDSSPTSASRGTVYFEMMVISDGGPFSLSFNSQTITTQGAFVFRLSPGTYEVTGQLRTNVVGIGFANAMGTYGRGGVRPGSVRNMAGPLLSLTQCGINWVTFAPPINVRAQFEVTDQATGCQTGV
jgi:hypothetical protein